MAESSTPSRFLGRFCQSCETVLSGLDLEEALDTAVGQAVECLEVKAGDIRLLDRPARVLTLAASRGLSPEYLAKGPVEVARSPLDREALEGRVVRVADVTTDPRFQYPAEAAREGLRSLLCVPLRFRSRRVGVLRVYSGERRDFGEEDEAVATVLAAQAAAAIANALRYRRLRTLNGIARTIVARLDVDGVLRRICEGAVESLSADRAVLYLLDRETGRLSGVAAAGPGSLAPAGPLPESDPVMAPCLRGEDVVAETDAPAPPGLPSGRRSILCVPVRRDAEVLGALRVEMAFPYAREEEDFEFLHALGDFGIVALENARLHEHLKRDYDDLTRDVWQWYDWGRRKPLT